MQLSIIAKVSSGVWPSPSLASKVVCVKHFRMHTVTTVVIFAALYSVKWKQAIQRAIDTARAPQFCYGLRTHS